MVRTLIAVAALAPLVLAAGAAAADRADEVDFVTRASAGDLMAVAESRVALRRAARGSGVAVPTALDPGRAARLASLRDLSGAAFDRAYLADQAEIHSNALTLYGDDMLLGDDPRLKALAIRMIPAAEAEFTAVQALSNR
ncbi:DUF4142 domain-containing protein [Lichenibacterium dinghuense]|uniref:DUF4142 domain-containing protein n=1 Tax=Lichenibacterium dinghuense TaxID=2895977 RepID=UPI001F2D3CDF|nr:DUF4142 domain-containing protein [Lichenibacterium sp. 6Y81]